MIKTYVPKQEILLVRNPAFKQWSPNSPDGHLDQVHIQIGVTPEQAVNETISGSLDWYMEAVPPDRLTELKAKYPDQVHLYPRNNVTYFSMNERKPPFDNLLVRQAVNYAIDRNALVKIFGGQGTPTETVLPPLFGTAYHEPNLYPYDVAKAKSLIQQAGAQGATVEVWTTNADPAPKAAQYLAGQLQAIGLNVSGVKAVDDSVYWDTLLTQKGDPQIAFNHFDQDYPEGEDFIDTLLNGEHIVNVGNNDVSNTDNPEINKDDRPDQAAPARRRAKRRLGEDRQHLHGEGRRLGAVSAPPGAQVRVGPAAWTRVYRLVLRAHPGDVAIAVGANAPDLPISLLRCFSWAKGSHPGGEGSDAECHLAPRSSQAARSSACRAGRCSGGRMS